MFRRMLVRQGSYLYRTIALTAPLTSHESLQNSLQGQVGARELPRADPCETEVSAAVSLAVDRATGAAIRAVALQQIRLWLPLRYVLPFGIPSETTILNHACSNIWNYVEHFLPRSALFSCNTYFRIAP